MTDVEAKNEGAKLKEFRAGMSSDAMREAMTDADCKRFLRARKWEVDKALDMVSVLLLFILSFIMNHRLKAGGNGLIQTARVALILLLKQYWINPILMSTSFND
jgi:hypothetical protein